MIQYKNKNNLGPRNNMYYAILVPAPNKLRLPYNLYTLYKQHRVFALRTDPLPLSISPTLTFEGRGLNKQTCVHNTLCSVYIVGFFGGLHARYARSMSASERHSLEAFRLTGILAKSQQTGPHEVRVLIVVIERINNNPNNSNNSSNHNNSSKQVSNHNSYC